MKKYYINTFLFIGLLFFLSILNLVKPNDISISEIENRVLKEMPKFNFNKLISGNFTMEFDEYFADRFLFRENFVKLNRQIKELQNVFNNEEAIIIVNKGLNFSNEIKNVENENTENVIENKGDEKETVNLDKKLENNNIQNNKSNDLEEDNSKLTGRILLLNDKAMETHIFNEEAAKYYAESINIIARKLDKKIKVYSIVAPIQIEFLKNKKYRELSSPQKYTIDYVKDYLDSRVTSVDVYSIISENIDKYLYFRTDHHWTALGAYYAYTSFMNTKGEEVIPIEKYEVDIIKPFLGTTYSATLSKRLEENPDYVKIYIPFINHDFYVYYNEPVKKEVIDMSHINKKNKYGVFLGGDYPLGKITTEINNGKSILVIKDSYANSFIPFLIPHYQNIYIVDPRFFKQNIIELIEEKEIQEVLFLNYIHVTGGKEFSGKIRKMLDQ